MAHPLKFASPLLDEATVAAAADVLRSGHITSGAWVERFEAALSAFCGGRPVRVVTSATAATVGSSISGLANFSGVGVGIRDD